MACGLGAAILVFMLVKHNVSSPAVETDLLTGDVQTLELRKEGLRQHLDELQNVSRSDTEKIARLQARLTEIKQTLTQKEISVKQKKEELSALKRDIASRPLAQKEDLIEDDRGGEENYLMGLRVEGRRIAILVDSSASMTDETLLEIIKRKNGSSLGKQQGPKWLRTRKTVRWLLARIPKKSEFTVIYFNDSVQPATNMGWFAADNPATIKKLYRELDSIVPKGATNLQKGLSAVSQLRPTDLYLITDGLPTVGDSRYASLNPFARCSSLLGKSTKISGECRVKLFRQTITDSSPKNVKVNVILLPIEGDPDAVNEYWSWAALTGGLVISPAVNWP
jgi:hypothetical protein